MHNINMWLLYSDHPGTSMQKEKVTGSTVHFIQNIYKHAIIFITAITV